MSTYAAVLGNHPNISLAELAATVPGFALKNLLHKKQVALFESSAALDQSFLDKLGGTIIFAQQVTENTVSLDDVPKLLINEVSKVKGKVTFSLRCWGLSPKQVRELYRTCKEECKWEGQSSRYVGSDHKPVIPVVLHEHHLIDGKGGCELMIVADEETLWIGRTIAAQNVDAYTKRDMEKPVRDTKVGLLPPKLAQILLNLGAWVEHGSAPDPKKAKPITIFDPFCGTGVIPMESLLRGWNVLASDKAKKAVDGCTTNLEWIRKEEGILKKEVTSEVWKHDATKPFECKEPPKVIVTETTLGTPFNKRPTIKDMQKEKSDNETLQAGFLQSTAESLPGVPIVCTWPVWYGSKSQLFLEKVWKAIDDAGFEPCLPPGIEATTERTSLLYRRPDQYVGREIVILKPKA